MAFFRTRQWLLGFGLTTFTAALTMGWFTPASDAKPLSVRSLAACLQSQRYDTRTRDRPQQAADPRLLIVAITEADLSRQTQWPLSDRTIANMLANLQRHQPTTIGLTWYRDQSFPPGETELRAQLRRPNVIMPYHPGDSDGLNAIAPPAGLPPDQIGVLDLQTDSDGVVRRHILTTQAHGEPVFSFSWQVATHYLRTKNVLPQVSSANANHIQLGPTVLAPLTSYCQSTAIDPLDYQIWLAYRSRRDVAPQVTLTQVLNQQVKPEWIRNKVVLIGVSAPVFNDYALTPYRDGRGGYLAIAGVELQAHMVSQLLTAGLGE